MADHPAVQVTEGAHGIHFWEHIADRWLTQEDITSYHQFFPRPPGGITGESTPQYMSLWWVPRMLADAAPDARIIVLVRDPVDRYVLGRSQLEDYRALNTARGMSDRSFTRRAAELSMHRGQYALQLAWLMQSYPRERILVLQHEQCVESVEPMLARTFDFLGIDATSPASRSHTSDADPAPTDVVVVEPERLDLLRRLYRPEVLRLKELVPELDLSLWPNFADLGD
jgi:Sulfotransferase family